MLVVSWWCLCQYDSNIDIGLGALSFAEASFPGNFRSWESPQTLPALFIGPFEHAERSRNLKFAVKDVRGWQFLTMKAAETLCIVCLPPEKNIWITDLPKKSHFIRV